jgi:hypothetical protein
MGGRFASKFHREHHQQSHLNRQTELVESSTDQQPQLIKQRIYRISSNSEISETDVIESNGRQLRQDM